MTRVPTATTRSYVIVAVVALAGDAAAGVCVDN
jgi:hypothetical protein